MTYLLLLACSSERQCDGGDISNFCEATPSGHYRLPPCPTKAEVVEEYCEADSRRDCITTRFGTCTVVTLYYSAPQAIFTFNQNGHLVDFKFWEDTDGYCSETPLHYGDDGGC